MTGTRKYLLILTITLFTTAMLSLGVDHLINLAHASADPTTPDPAVSLIDLLMTGKYMAAVGAFLIAFVALIRGTLGSKIAWLQTKPGGYVLGFGSAAVLYVASALQSNQPLTAGVFFAAAAAGWTAAGGWEHISDLISWLRPTTPAQQVPPAITPPGNTPSAGPGAAIQAAIVLGIVSVCAISGSLVMQSCTGPKSPGQVVIDCTKADAAQTIALLDDLKPLLSGNPVSWSAIEAKAIAAGETIGGCVLAQLVQNALSSTSVAAVPVENTWMARGALEDFRSRVANGATFHTAKGEI
jgi:hypothetical protein